MFVKECDAVVCFPGGFGTLDEGLEVLTLLQTGKRDMVPVIFMNPEGGDFWEPFHQFVLDPVNEDEPISNVDVITSIKEFLDSIGEKSNFAVISNGDTIKIQSINGRQIERTPKPNQQMFSCTHCGHITQYEVEHNNHVKIHYM